MLRNILLGCLSVLFFISCDSVQKKEADQNPLGIEMNAGKKWEVNAEMKPHIEKGNQILEAYKETLDTNYVALASMLREQNNALIQSCTMKGESHDELHKWLHPHMGLIAELDKAENQEEAEKIIAKLEGSFEVYGQYFN